MGNIALPKNVKFEKTKEENTSIVERLNEMINTSENDDEIKELVIK